MKVEVWSDIVCPFCYIGKRKFEKALDSFEGKDAVEIEWKSFQLNPDGIPVPGQSVHEYLAAHKGVSVAEGKRMNDTMTAIAAEVGLRYDFDKAIVANTLNGHSLLHLAKKHGLQNQMKERLFAAYYVEGKNIGDIETLVLLGTEVGLQTDEIRGALVNGLFHSDVDTDQYEAQQIGVQGVPFFVFNNKYAVSGAQSPEVFKEVLEKVWSEENPVPLATSERFCSIDGDC